MQLYLDGVVSDAEGIEVKPSSTLWRGQGWFETIALHENCLLNPDKHLERLVHSLPSGLEEAISVADEVHNLRVLGDASSYETGSIKLVVWKEDETIRRFGWVREYEPPDAGQYREGVDLTIQKRSHPPRWPLSDQKRTSYASVMAERDRTSAWDVLYCDLQGHVWETGIANILWHDQGTIHYPPPDGHYLIGTVMEAVLDRARGMGLEVQPRQGEWDSLGDLCWITNSMVGMLPVRNIDRVSYGRSERPSWWLELRETLLSDRVFPRWYDELFE